MAFSDGLNARLNSVVRQFNSKVKRLTNEGLKYLPEEINIEELRETYQYSPQALKRKLDILEQFTEKGAEKLVELGGGAKITEWELEALKKETRSLKQYLTREMNEYGDIIPKIGGVKQVASYAQMGDATFENLKVIRKSLDKDLNKVNQRDLNLFKKKTKNLTKRRLTQDYIFKQNYVDFVQDLYDRIKDNKMNDLDIEFIDDLVEKINSYDAHDFYDKYQEEKRMQDIRNKYATTKVIIGNFSDTDVEEIVKDLKFISDVLS